MKIFISYSRADGGGFAKHIKDSYENIHEIFLDQVSLVASEAWRNQIQSKIMEADIIVAIITNRALSSEEVDKEILEAQRLEKRIVPCKLDTVSLEELKWGLDNIQWLDFDDKFALIRVLDTFLEQKLTAIASGSKTNLATTIDPLATTIDPLDFYNQLSYLLDSGYTIFKNQIELRDQLASSLHRRHDHQNVQYEKLFADFYNKMTREETIKFKIIRRQTDRLKEFNKKTFDLLELHGKRYMQEMQELKQLRDHLELWLDKYEILKDDPNVALIYVGVEEKKPFPSGIEDLVMRNIRKISGKVIPEEEQKFVNLPGTIKDEILGLREEYNSLVLGENTLDDFLEKLLTFLTEFTRNSNVEETIGRERVDSAANFFITVANRIERYKEFRAIGNIVDEGHEARILTIESGKVLDKLYDFISIEHHLLNLLKENNVFEFNEITKNHRKTGKIDHGYPVNERPFTYRLDFNGAMLYEANLDGIDLHEADICRTNLDRINLTGADLNWANFATARAEYGVFRHAKMQNAYLSGAILTCADLSYADLSHAILLNANLDFTNLSETNFHNAVLVDCRFYKEMVATNADFGGAIIDNMALVNYLKRQRARNVPDSIVSIEDLKIALKEKKYEPKTIEKIVDRSRLISN